MIDASLSPPVASVWTEGSAGPQEFTLHVREGFPRHVLYLDGAPLHMEDGSPAAFVSAPMALAHLLDATGFLTSVAEFAPRVRPMVA